MYNKGIFEEKKIFLTVTHCSIVLGVINIFFEKFFLGSTFNHHADDGKRNRLSQKSLINLCRIPTLRSPTIICKSLGKDLTVKETVASFAEGAMHQTITIHVIRGNSGSDPRPSAVVLPNEL